MTRITGKTVNPDLDQDVITFQIAGVEQGRITGSSNTIGGGFAIGSSYLKAIASISSTSVASGDNVTLRWTLDDLDGSDLAIHGGDGGTLIDFLTAGWYQISFPFVANSSVGNSFNFSYWEIFSPTNSAAWDSATSQITAGQESAGVITTEWAEWAVNDQIRVDAQAILSLGGTWTLGGTSTYIAIMRGS